jgi:hypothetical protein
MFLTYKSLVLFLVFNNNSPLGGYELQRKTHRLIDSQGYGNSEFDTQLVL